MRLDEIIIDSGDTLVDRLIDNISKDVLSLYNEIGIGSNNFNLHVEDVYTLEEITEFRYKL